MTRIERFNIFGTEFSITNLEKAVEFLKQYDFKKKGYVCISDTYMAVLAGRNDFIREILNQSLLTLPDGKPLEFYARLKGFHEISTVSGYFLIKGLMKPGIRHYFYGSDEQSLLRIYNYLKSEYPDGEIIGYKAPPFLSQDVIKDNPLIAQDIEAINVMGPDIVWIGISSPKQDILMNSTYKMLDHGIMIGVGGVFDYLSGKTIMSPSWVKSIGLRWLFRFVQEPERLWKKYFTAFTGFILLLCKEFVSGKKQHNP